MIYSKKSYWNGSVLLLISLILATAKSHAAPSSVALDNLIFPASLEFQWHQQKKQQRLEVQIAEKFGEALFLVRASENTSIYPSLFKGREKNTAWQLDQRRVVFLLSDSNYVTFQGHQIPIANSATVFSVYENNPNLTETIYVALPMDPALVSLDGKLLRNAEWTLFRLLLRPFFFSLVGTLKDPIQVSLDRTRHPRDHNTVVWRQFFETRYSFFLRELNDKEVHSVEDPIAYRGYAFLAWLDLAMHTRTPDGMSLPFVNSTSFVLSLNDTFCAPDNQQEVWRTWGEAMALLRALPPQATENNLFRSDGTPRNLHAFYLLDSRDLALRKNVTNLGKNQFSADHFLNITETHRHKVNEPSQGLHFNAHSHYHWTDRTVYDPNTQLLQKARLARMSLSLAQYLFHPDPMQPDSQKNASLGRSAAIDFFLRLIESRYWSELSDEAKTGFKEEISVYTVDTGKLDACALELIRNALKSK